MTSQTKKTLQERTLRAAEAVLKQRGAVGPIELLEQIGFLASPHIDQWKRGNPSYPSLEPHIQCGQKKLEQTYQFFLEWVRKKKLEPIEASYSLASRQGAKLLQISTAGDTESEKFFQTQFRSADLTPAKKQRIEQKINKVPDLVAYQITGKPSKCCDCSEELEAGDLIVLENGDAVCLVCADMDHLEFLPSGNTAMTRRSKKLSPLSAIVMRFERRRKRYQRQGILVTSAAIDAAEEQCAADSEQRAERRERAAERRADQDEKMVEGMTQLILESYPGCLPEEAGQIASHTAVRGSGRVGRSAAGRGLEPDAITLAVVAWIRHQHTDYDELLMQGTERQLARQLIREAKDAVIRKWKTS